MKNSGGDLSLFWIVLIAVVAADFVSKILAVTYLSPIPQPVLGDFLQWQLAFNRGAAFCIEIGSASRLIFSLLVGAVLVFLGLVVQATDRQERVRLVALALVCGGAAGNLLDRLRSARGVVDFIDIGAFGYRLPNFNVADVAIVVGAFTFLATMNRGHPVS